MASLAGPDYEPGPIRDMTCADLAAFAKKHGMHQAVVGWILSEEVDGGLALALEKTDVDALEFSSVMTKRRVEVAIGKLKEMADEGPHAQGRQKYWLHGAKQSAPAVATIAYNRAVGDMTLNRPPSSPLKCAPFDQITPGSMPQTSRRTMDNNLKSRSKVKIASLVKSASHQGQKCKKSASLFYIKKQNLHPLFINIFIVTCTSLLSTNLNFEKIIKNAN